MAERPLPRNLRAGAAGLALLALLGLAAPLLATDLPLIARGPEGLSTPALRQALGGRPQGWYEVLLAAPVPHAPPTIRLEEALRAPSRPHPLGTDALGRDLAARVIHGARVSLAVGLMAAAFAVLVGVTLGGAAGYLGGWSDAVVSRLVEAVLCFPSILLVLVVLATDPPILAALPDALRIALVIGATGWVGVARYMRGEFLKLAGSDMVSAARASGAGHWRIAARHILPSSLAPVLVTASFAVAGAIVLEAALSFLGLGIAPPTPSWGGLLHEARDQVHRAWWLALFPGLALFAAVLACNLVGEGIRDWLDPRGRTRDAG